MMALFWSTSIAAELEYRANFTFSILSSAINLFTGVFTLALFFRHGAALGGWSWAEAVVVLGMFTILQGVAAAFFQPNLNRIVDHVRQGTLDFVLLKPIDTQFWLSTRRLSPWGLPDIALGSAMAAYGVGTAPVTALAVIMALACFVCSVAILYSIWFMMATTTVWFVQVSNVTEVLRALLDAGRFPIDAFPAGTYRFIFTFVVPVAFMTSVPAHALLGKGSLLSLVFAVAIAIALLLASRAWFRYALRDYTSASS